MSPADRIPRIVDPGRLARERLRRYVTGLSAYGWHHLANIAIANNDDDDNNNNNNLGDTDRLFRPLCAVAVIAMKLGETWMKNAAIVVVLVDYMESLSMIGEITRLGQTIKQTISIIDTISTNWQSI